MERFGRSSPMRGCSGDARVTKHVRFGTVKRDPWCFEGRQRGETGLKRGGNSFIHLFGFIFNKSGSCAAEPNKTTAVLGFWFSPTT